jgi:NitT/TauT family transport system substrate-binding protein
MRRKLVAILPAILAAVSYCGIAAAQDLTTVRFVLDWKFEGQQAQFTAPVEDGTFKKMGLNVQIDRGQGSADTVAKVASGAYDIGHADTYAMIRFNAANPNTPLISVAIVQDASAVGIVALRSKGIATPQDLIGKKLYSRSLRSRIRSTAVRSSGIRFLPICATRCWPGRKPMP